MDLLQGRVDLVARAELARERDADHAVPARAMRLVARRRAHRGADLTLRFGHRLDRQRERHLARLRRDAGALRRLAHRLRRAGQAHLARARRRRGDDVTRALQHLVALRFFGHEARELHEIAVGQERRDLAQLEPAQLDLAEPRHDLVARALEPVEVVAVAQVLAHHVADLVDELRLATLREERGLLALQRVELLVRDLPRRPRRRRRSRLLGALGPPATDEEGEDRDEEQRAQHAEDPRQRVVLLHHHHRLRARARLGVRLVRDVAADGDGARLGPDVADLAVGGDHPQPQRGELDLARLEREELEREGVATLAVLRGFGDE